MTESVALDGLEEDDLQEKSLGSLEAVVSDKVHVSELKDGQTIQKTTDAKGHISSLIKYPSDRPLSQLPVVPLEAADAESGSAIRRIQNVLGHLNSQAFSKQLVMGGPASGELSPATTGLNLKQLSNQVKSYFAARKEALDRLQNKVEPSLLAHKKLLEDLKLKSEPEKSESPHYDFKALAEEVKKADDETKDAREGLEPKVEKASEQAKKSGFLNPALEIVQAGLKYETEATRKLNGHIAEAEKHQKDIDLLLDLSGKLKGDSLEISGDVKRLLEQLKERGLDLSYKNDGTPMNKEEISQLKSLTSAQVDKIRSNLQILFTTKIQLLVNNMSSIMETLKEMVRNNTQLIRTANRLPGH